MPPVTISTDTLPLPLPTTDQYRLLADAPWRRLVVLGDSVAAGVGDAVAGFPDRPWADQLAAALDAASPGLVYRNLGVRGLKSDEILTDQLGPALESGPDLAVVSAGGNDLLGRRFDPDLTERRLDALIGALASAGALVVTFSLFDLSATPFVPAEMRDELRRRLRALSAVTERVTAAHGGVHVDYQSDPRTGDPALYSADQLHANGRGQALVLSGMVHGLAAAVARANEHGHAAVGVG